MPAARRCADGATVLLRASHEVGEAVVRGHVIDLRGWLVVPGAPGRGSIHAYNSPLIAGDDHSLWIVGIDPELVIVVAAGRAFDRCPCLTGVRRSIDGRIHDVNGVLVFRIDGNLFEVPAAVPQSFVGGKSGPGRARIIRSKNPTFFCIDSGIDAIAICGCYGNSDLATSFSR